MGKVVFPGMDQMISDYNTLERNLRDMRTVIACICLQQDDRTFSVPFDELKKVTPEMELEVAVDCVHGNYVFTLVGGAAVPEGAGLAGDDHVAGGLG